MKQYEFSKIESLCNEYNMIQCIDEPTHFTGNSIWTIDLFFVTNKESGLTTGVGDPCLGLTTRYHCPVFWRFQFPQTQKQKYQSNYLKYELGNYEFRNSFANFDWDSVHNNNINVYAENLADTISENASR